MDIRKIMVSLAAACGVFACCVMGGCANGSSEDSPGSADSASGSLVVAVQKTQNVPVYSAAFADDYVKSAQKTHDLFNVVVIDGDPFFALEQSVTLGSSKNNERNAEKEEVAQRSQVASAIASAAGKTDGASVLPALALANRVHASSKSDGEARTIVAASGLTDVAPWDMSEVGLDVEADTVAAYWANLGYDLSSTDEVIFYSFGDVAGEQQKLTPLAKKNLQVIYEDALCALGVGKVTFCDDPCASAEVAADGPSVKLIDVPEPAPMADVVCGEANKLDSETLPFVAGTAELVDESSAKEVLQPFADALLRDDKATCLLSGSTASYPWDENLAYNLGLQRAETVKALLVEAGVQEQRITVQSFGSDAPNHVPDIDPTTGLQTLQAQANRWVSIEIDNAS